MVVAQLSVDLSLARLISISAWASTSSSNLSVVTVLFGVEQVFLVFPGDHPNTIEGGHHESRPTNPIRELHVLAIRVDTL